MLEKAMFNFAKSHGLAIKAHYLKQAKQAMYHCEKF